MRSIEVFSFCRAKIRNIYRRYKNLLWLVPTVSFWVVLMWFYLASGHRIVDLCTDAWSVIYCFTNHTALATEYMPCIAYVPFPVPFHQNRKVIETEPVYSDFELTLSPSANFFASFMSRGSAINILQPHWSAG